MTIELCPVCGNFQDDGTDGGSGRHGAADHGVCRICERVVHVDFYGRAAWHTRRRCMGIATCPGSHEGTLPMPKPAAPKPVDP